MAPKKTTTPEATTRRSSRVTPGDAVSETKKPAKVMKKKALSAKNTVVSAAKDRATEWLGRPKKSDAGPPSPKPPASRLPSETKEAKEDINPVLTALSTELRSYRAHGGDAKDIQDRLRSAFMILSEIRRTPEKLTFSKASATTLTGHWEAMTGLNLADTVDHRNKANDFINDPTAILSTTVEPATHEIPLSPKKVASPRKGRGTSVEPRSPRKRETRSVSPTKKMSETSGVGRRTSSLSGKTRTSTRPRNSSTSSQIPAPSVPAPSMPPQAYLRGTVSSSNNQQFIPGMKDADGNVKTNPFFELMPTPPIWHRRMPPYFPFGETPYMERLMSDQINRDLANGRDVDKPKRSWGDTLNNLLGRAGSPVGQDAASDAAGPASPHHDHHTFRSPWALPEVDVEALKEILRGSSSTGERQVSPAKDLGSPSRTRQASRS